MVWELPSKRVRELIRRGAEIVLTPAPAWLAELDEAILSGSNMHAIAADPVLAAGTRRTNRANLATWAAANINDPGARVPVVLSEAALAVARDLVRRGLNESALDAYRIGQGVSLRLWTRIAFTLTADAAELSELLDVSCRSISTFVDDTVAAISARMQAERADLTRGSHAERRETVMLLLDGAPIGGPRAEARLGYQLTGTHTAAVVWSDDPDSDLSHLDRAADLLATVAGEPHPLIVTASAATRWVWVHGAPEAVRLRAELGGLPAVRLALGPADAGLDGFRRSHLHALTVQRMLARLASPQQLATHAEVELVSLVTQDPQRADDFIKRTLGGLETAPPEITGAVRAFLAEQCNASRAAERLFTHRNTLLRRLQRADQLLPRPLAADSVHVAVALEVLHWRGR
ncbi:PucR family transcriptional regulator [Actinoplanes sp. NPDC024001]|uniref:PucR family transcriptional regulator n=1 Tax=Actinoplanes sp. NPDC024001 TaxID=3154598 RepID=UPI0033F04B5D